MDETNAYESFAALVRSIRKYEQGTQSLVGGTGLDASGINMIRLTSPSPLWEKA